nr:retrovirus-related Pol polyprotein from transposon TNT 1-94 [Tanacetum cinerariifolium]
MLQFKMAELWFRMFRVDRIEVRGPIHGVEVQLGLGEFRTELGMLIHVKQDRLSATTAMLLFLAGGQDTAIDEDVDEQLVQDLALNVDNVFQADECDAFDSDVDEALTAQTMFMANLSSADPVNDKAGPSYDLNILSEVQDHDKYQDTICAHHEEHAIMQILWGVVNRAHLDYAERVWEEFNQSIHIFIEDKKNLAQHTHRKKKATLIVIPSIQFTKLIIYHLQRKHKFYPRPGSPLHSSNEEPVLEYLKFSAKGTKREGFGMPIPGNLITADIQDESYYREYLAKVAKHQRYLASETGSDPESLVPKPTKTTKKSKPSAPKSDLRPPASPARKSRLGLVSKRRKSISSLRSVDESVTEGIPKKEPRVDDEEADELESGKYQPLLEVQGKGKKKVTDEQVARDLLTLQTPKKKSHADQYIFQRCTSTPTGSFGHDGSSSLYAELGLTNSEVESDEDVSGIDVGVQGEGQVGPNPDDQDEGQARPKPDKQAEGQAGPNPGDAAASQPLLSPIVHARPNLENMDFEVANVSTQPHPEQMDEGFTTTAYPKTTAETEAESMVYVTIQLDTSSIPPMTTPVIDLTSRTESPNVHQPLQATKTKTTTTTTTIHPPTSQPQESTTDSIHGARLYILKNLDIPYQVSKAVDKIVTDVVDWAIQAPLWNRFRDLPEADMKEILHQRMWETNSYKTHEDHMMLYEALEKSMNHDHFEELAKDLAEARKKKKKRLDSAKTPPGSPPHQPPPLPPPTGPSGDSGSPRASGSPGASRSSQVRHHLLHLHPPTKKQDWWKPLEEERPTTPEPVWSISSFDVPTSDIAMFMDWFCKRQGITKLKPQDLEGPVFELVKVFHPNVIHLQYQMEECHKLLTDSVDDLILRHNVSKPLPLGGPPGQVTIQYDFFFNKDLEYLRYDSMGSRHALSILKMKATYYPDVGLEQMMPDQIHTSEVDRRAVRTHMRILSVVRIEVFSMYGKDVDRSKEFMFAIQKRLKTRRIFRNLESFVGGRVRDGDYRLLKRTE